MTEQKMCQNHQKTILDMSEYLTPDFCNSNVIGKYNFFTEWNTREWPFSLTLMKYQHFKEQHSTRFTTFWQFVLVYWDSSLDFRHSVQ